MADRLLAAFAEAYPRATFLEIGANDGRRYDPLAAFVAESEWTGVMIEPVPYVFERLRRNLGHNDRVALENIAIADRNGTRPFYFVAERAGDAVGPEVHWYDAIGSFDREHLRKHAEVIPKAVIPDLENRIQMLEVPTATVADVCRRHGIGNPDLVLIDAEGYDAEIVGSIDFEEVRPRLLIYEHHHLTDDAREHCEERLRRLGYQLLEDGLNTWCLDARIADGLAARWPDPTG